MFTENIERIRKLKKLSQRELAESLGMSTQNYNNMVNKTKNFWVSDLLKIAEILEVPVTTLLDNSANPIVGKSSARVSDYKAERDYYKDLYEKSQSTVESLARSMEAITGKKGATQKRN